MKNTVYSFKMLSLLIVLAFSNYSMAQEVSLKKQDVKTKKKKPRPISPVTCQVMLMPMTTKAGSNQPM